MACIGFVAPLFSATNGELASGRAVKVPNFADFGIVSRTHWESERPSPAVSLSYICAPSAPHLVAGDPDLDAECDQDYVAVGGGMCSASKRRHPLLTRSL